MAIPNDSYSQNSSDTIQSRLSSILDVYDINVHTGPRSPAGYLTIATRDHSVGDLAFGAPFDPNDNIFSLTTKDSWQTLVDLVSDKSVSTRELFIRIMAWGGQELGGHMTGPNARKLAARMTEDNLKSVDSLRWGGVSRREMYAEFKRMAIPYCNTAFFTKVITAFTYYLPAGQRGFILDQNLAKAMDVLRLHNNDLAAQGLDHTVYPKLKLGKYNQDPRLPKSKEDNRPENWGKPEGVDADGFEQFCLAMENQVKSDVEAVVGREVTLQEVDIAIFGIGQKFHDPVGRYFDLAQAEPQTISNNRWKYINQAKKVKAESVAVALGNPSSGLMTFIGGLSYMHRESAVRKAKAKASILGLNAEQVVEALRKELV